MRVKKFEAKSMKEALAMVKNELGPDAVILAARDNRKFGLAGEASVEVTAAVSESTLQRKKFVESRMTHRDKERFSKSDAKSQRELIEKMIESRDRQKREDLESKDSEVRRDRRITAVSYIDIPDDDESPSLRRRDLSRESGRDSERDTSRDSSRERGREMITRAVRRPISRAEVEQAILAKAESDKLQVRAQASRRSISASESPTPLDEKEPSAQARARIREAARAAFTNNPFFDEEKRAARDAGASKVLSPSATAASSRTTVSVDGRETEVETLRSEILRLQQALDGFQKVPQTFATMHPGADYGIPYDFSFMYQKLTESGVTVDNAVEILQAAQKEIDPVQAKKRPIIDAWVARYFLSQVQINPTPFQGRVHLFVGGAGSGKTSTLVKIASHLVVREKKKVAILTTDAFKVGAVDQLKIYCQILNVPFAVIRNRKDWEWVLNQLQAMDHILVDFPGFQLRDLDEIHQLKSLLPGEGVAAQTHFCVSATTKDGDAYEISKRYRVADYNDLIVTNLDQSTQHGIIYNIQRKTAKPLHSFGIGNRIPEDFELASKERVLDLIFRLTKFKKENR